MRRIVRSLATAAALILASASFARAEDEPAVAFEKAAVARAGEAFEARLATADPIEAREATVQFISETVQIDLADASFPKGKLMLKADDPVVKSAYIYEPDSKTVRVRLILNKGIAARSFDGLVQVARADGALTIRLLGKGAKRAVGRRAQQELTRKTAIVEDSGAAEAVAAVASKLGASAPAASAEAPDVPAKLTVDAGPEAAIARARAEAMAPATAAAANSEASVALPGAAPAAAAAEKAQSIGSAAIASDAITAKTPESAIPLAIGDKKDKKSDSDPLRRALIGVVVLAIALGAGAYGLKKLAKKTGPKTNAKIQIIGQHFLGPKKSLAIVHVAGESMLLGITDNSITLIKSLALIDDEVPAHLPNTFDGAMEQDAAGAVIDDGYDAAAEDDFDNFAMRGLSEIRDVVSGRLGQRNRR